MYTMMGTLEVATGMDCKAKRNLCTLFRIPSITLWFSYLGQLLLCMPCQGGGAPGIALKRATDSQQLILSTCKVAEDRW